MTLSDLLQKILSGAQSELELLVLGLVLLLLRFWGAKVQKEVAEHLVAKSLTQKEDGSKIEQDVQNKNGKEDIEESTLAKNTAQKLIDEADTTRKTDNHTSYSQTGELVL